MIQTCENCQKTFERRGKQQFCSRKCFSESTWETKACLVCEKLFRCRKKSQKFSCSRSCANSWQHSQGHRRDFVNDKTTLEWWIEKFGSEKARQLWEERNLAISKRTSGEKNPMFGRNDQTFGLKEFCKNSKGKTLSEIHGVEKASVISKKHSLSVTGENNPAFGKIYHNGGKSVKGHYKGHFFRSLFEYSFMKHLESQGFDLSVDVSYESFRVPYEFEGRKRTYTVDFFVKSEGIVYEVKPFYALKNERNQIKFGAAKLFFEKLGISFRIVTENEFRKIPFDEAFKDTNIVWKEETFRYFRKSSSMDTRD